MMCKRIIILARKLCEEPVCTEQGNAGLMYKHNYTSKEVQPCLNALSKEMQL